MSKARFAIRPCGVVWDNLCDAPANGELSTRATCYACGQPACRACSVVIPWFAYGRQRIGFDCLQQYDRDDALSAALAGRGR
jgi:hypothetical protein